MLVFWVTGKLLLTALRSRHRASDTSNAGKSALIQRIERQMFAPYVVPYIRIRPFDNRIAYPFGLQSAILKQPAAVVIIIVEDDFL